METLSALAARFGAPVSLTEIETHQLGRPPPASGHAALVLAYLATLGHEANSTLELKAVLDALEGEEELGWWELPEGLAVTSASDGWWVLFTGPADE